MTPAPPKFTRRQEEILEAAATGLGCLEIANALGIAPRTASSHLQTIYRALRLSGPGAGIKLSLWAVQHGYGKGVKPL